MVVITSLRILAIAMLGLTASSSVNAQADDPSVEAAVYHAAGNSTKVQSDIVITDPTASTVWYAQDTISIRWTGTTPTDFAFQIINKDSTVRASGMTLLAEANTAAGTASSRIGKIEPGTYFVRLYVPTDTTKEIARSSSFTIKAKSDKPTSSVSTLTMANSTSTGTSGTSTSFTQGATSDQANGTTSNNGSSTTTSVKDAALAKYNMRSVNVGVLLLGSVSVVALVI